MAGAVDEDTRESIRSGRETVGGMLSAAQGDLQKVFIAAVLGLMGTIWVLRRFVWDMLKADLLYERMPTAVAEQTKVVAVTPFDVILLQVKIGLVIGLLVAIPLFVWYSRDALRERGLWPGERVPRWKLAIIAALSLVLTAAGVAYAYYLFFPFMFDFLATNAVNVGFTPTYSIVKWAEFIILLTISFALAAQLPLVMSALSYTGIVPYETFRDKWRYAILGIFGFGALFSPPDPFTQVMWALPLILLYAFSLQLARFVVLAKRSSARVDVRSVARDRWNVLAGMGVLAFAAVYAFFTRGGLDAVNRGFGEIPAKYRPSPLVHLSETTGLPDDVAAAIVALVVTVLAVGLTLFYLTTRRLAESGPLGPAPASAGDPGAIDLDELTAGGVRAAPPEAFADLSEDEVTAKAKAALDADDPDKAEAIFDRYDEVKAQPPRADDEADESDAGGAEAADAEDSADDDAGTVTETAAGMMNAFTEDETTEDDIGGYYYDVAFILDSLTSKAFRLVAVFMVVMGATFVWLYQGGIRRVKETFFRQMPPALQPDVDIVTLHPVEALIFEIKFSTLLAVVVTLPLVLYYAWPALKERGLVRGDSRVMLVWGGTLVSGVVLGSVIGFLYVSPALISWLAADAIRSNMIIAYRINNFGWLIIYTTVGIGLLAEIPVSMVLFHVGDIVSYHKMARYWRHVVIALFAVAALVSPRGVFTMLLIAVPAALAYILGLAVLWALTLGGRRRRPGVRRASTE
jgi:sec-independent protein translocase protein TatC